MRAAGSGSQHYPAPDVVASNNARTLAIECKLTTAMRQYFTKQEVRELVEFSNKFGAEPWLAVKFSRQGWWFFSIDCAHETEKFHVISLDQAKSRGLTFEELLS